MTKELPVHHEFFPTDIRFVNSHINVVIGNDILVSNLIAIQSKLNGYGLFMEDSLILLNWLVRRILTKLNIKVLDYELNSDYEELYLEFFQEDDVFILSSVKGILEMKDFTPTVVQSIANGKVIFLSFGATNALDYNKSTSQQ